MAGGSLGSLTIDLAANISRFEKSLNRAEQLAEKRSRTIKRSFTRLATGLGTALASYGFVNAIEGALQFADAIGKAADRAGIGTQKLQELRFAADQFGISTKQLDDGMRRFTRRLGVALDGGSFAKDFKDLGVAIRDVNGNVRSSEQVFDDVVAAMGNLGSAAQKSKVAAQLFGDDAGPQLALLLGQGSKAINGLAAEANKLGIVMGDRLIRNAERANDELSKIGQIAKVGATKALAEFADEIEQVSIAMIAIISGDAGKLPDWLKDVAYYSTVAAKEFADLGDWAGAVGAVLGKLFTFEFDGIQTIIDARKENRAQLEGDLAAYREWLDTVSNGAETETRGKGTSDSLKNEEPVNIFTGLTDSEMENQLQAAIDMEEKNIAAFDAAEKKKADAALQSAQIIDNSRITTAQLGLQLLQQFAGKSKTLAALSIAVSKALAAVQVTTANTVAAEAAGASAAMAAPPGGGLAAYAAAKAAVQSQLPIQLGLIAAAGAAGIANVYANSGAGAAAGSPSNPISTTGGADDFTSNQFATPSGTVGTITINVNGVVTDEIMQDLVIPAIQDAANDKDVILFRSDSRQALELE